MITIYRVLHCRLNEHWNHMQMKKILNWRSDVEMKTFYEITIIKNRIAIIFFFCAELKMYTTLCGYCDDVFYIISWHPVLLLVLRFYNRYQSEIIFTLSDFRFLFPLQLLFFLLCPFGCFLICKFTPASVRTNNYCFMFCKKQS